MLNDPHQVGGIRQIAVVEHESDIPLMRVLVEGVDALRIEARSPAFDAVYFVSLFEKQLRQVRAVLAGHAGNQRFSSHPLTSIRSLTRAARMRHVLTPLGGLEQVPDPLAQRAAQPVID